MNHLSTLPSLYKSLSIVACVLLLLSGVHAKQGSYQTYVVHTHGDPNLVTVVQNELSPAHGGSGGTATLYQDQLIIRATPQDYARILPLIRQIDTAPTPLTVSVTLSNQQASSQSGGYVNAGIIKQGVWINGQYHNTQIQSTSNAHYTARTQSGSAVKIGTNTLIGLSTPRIHHNRYRTWVNFGTSWVVLHDGFSATPRVLPNGQIGLDIHTASTNREHLEASGLNTSLTITRGQWTKIGEIRTDDGQSSSYGQLSSAQIMPIWVKVD